MLQAIRDRLTGWIAIVVVLAIGIPFAFFGVGDFFMSQSADYVAKVGDDEIGTRDFNDRFNRYRQQMQQQFEGQIDASFFDRPEIRMQILEDMITEQLLLQAGRNAGLVVPAQRLRDEIAAVPAFQLDGAFNREVYVNVLNANRMTVPMFEQQVARDIESRELLNRIGQTALVTASDVDSFVRLRDQTRNFQYVTIEAPPLDAEFEPTAEAIEAYYTENSSRFMTTEQVDVEYIELLASELEVDMDVDESELRERYQMQLSQYGTPEQRLASHILIAIDGDGDAEAHRVALARAEELRQQLLDGADFAALAQEHSADPGSARSGGDLGFLEPGLTDPAFDEALFAMAEPGYSEPVLTGEGFHLIWLREIQEGDVRSFEDVRAELERSFREPERERRFIEEQGRMYDLIFQDSGTLEPIADAMGLEIKRSGLFDRSGGDGIAAEREVINQAFSELVLQQGGTSDPIEVGPGRAVALRVVEHRPSVARPLDEVRPQIIASLREQERLDRAQQRAEQLEQRWTAGEVTLEALAEEFGSVVQNAEGAGRFAGAHDSSLVSAVFEMPRPDVGGTQRQRVDLGGGNVALVVLSAVSDGDPSLLTQEERERVENTLRNNRTQLETEAFIAALRESVDVQIFEDRLAR